MMVLPAPASWAMRWRMRRLGEHDRVDCLHLVRQQMNAGVVGGKKGIGRVGAAQALCLQGELKMARLRRECGCRDMLLNRIPRGGGQDSRIVD